MAERHFLTVAQRQMVEIADMLPKQPAEIIDTILLAQVLVLAGLVGIVAAVVADTWRQRAGGKGGV